MSALKGRSCALEKKMGSASDESRRSRERASSRWPQIAKQNCTAGGPKGIKRGRADARPSDEDAIWRSEVRLKGVAGDMAKRLSPDMSMEALSKRVF